MPLCLPLICVYLFSCCRIHYHDPIMYILLSTYLDSNMQIGRNWMEHPPTKYHLNFRHSDFSHDFNNTLLVRWFLILSWYTHKLIRWIFYVCKLPYIPPFHAQQLVIFRIPTGSLFQLIYHALFGTIWLVVCTYWIQWVLILEFILYFYQIVLSLKY